MSLSVLGVRFLFSQFYLERELSWAANEKAVPRSTQQLRGMLGAGDSEMDKPLPSRKRAWPRLRGHCCPLPPSCIRYDQEQLCHARLLAMQSLSLLGGLGPVLSSWNRPTP